MERFFIGQSILRRSVSQASAERLLVACIRYGMTPETLFHFQCIVRVTVRDWLQPTPLILAKIA
jgi:hypothetical protein